MPESLAFIGLGRMGFAMASNLAASSRSPMPIIDLLCDRYLSAIARGRENLDATALALGAADDAGVRWYDSPGRTE